MTKKIISAVIILLIAGIIGSYVWFTYPEHQYNQFKTTHVGDRLLYSEEWTGGMCAYGPCSSLYQIYDDGAWVKVGQADPVYGFFNAERLADLRRQIAAIDFQKIKSEKFTGMCPTAYDGSISIYTFRTVHGTETLSECVYDLRGKKFISGF